MKRAIALTTAVVSFAVSMSFGSPGGAVVKAADVTTGTLGPFLVNISLKDCTTSCPGYVPEIDTYVRGTIGIQAPTQQPQGRLSDFSITAKLLRDGREVPDGLNQGPGGTAPQLFDFGIGWKICYASGPTCSGFSDFTMHPDETGNYQMYISGTYTLQSGSSAAKVPVSATLDLFTITSSVVEEVGDVVCMKAKGQPEECFDGARWTYDFCWDNAKYFSLQKRTGATWSTLTKSVAKKSSACDGSAPWRVKVSRTETSYGTSAYRIYFPPQFGDSSGTDELRVTLN